MGTSSTTLPPGLSAALAERYRLERELGAGGMATVYLALDLKHDRHVAIKVLHEDLGATLGPERFLAEIKTTAKLQHPHILPLLDSGEAAGLLYYVMPYVAGESLRDRLHREKQLPIEDAVRIAREVADAMGHAHGHGIVHRDIKPENVLLQEGHALVADFGIALAVQSAGGQRMTQTGLSLGTPQYMAPEQAMGEKVVDHRADIYALGAVAYEMLTGEPPFTGATVQAIVAKVLSERPTPPSVLRDTVPPHIEAAVLKALAKLPADRFATAVQFMAAIGASEASKSDPRRAPASTRTSGRSERTYLLVALAGLIALAVGGGMLWRSRSHAVRATVLRHVESYPLLEAERQERRFALSPDGQQFAYVTAAGSGVSHIEIRNRSELRSTPVAGTERAISVFYSPDGDQLGFLVDNPLMLKTVRPGRPVATVAPMRGGISGGTDPTWGNDGWIYVSGPGFRVVRRYRPDGSASEDLTTVDTLNGEWWHGHPEPLPGGRGVLFTVRMRDLEYRIAIADIAHGTHRVLVSGVRAFVAPGGQLLVVGADGTVRAATFDARTLQMTGSLAPVESGIRLRGLATVQLAMSANGTLVFEERTNVDSAANDLVWLTPTGRLESLASVGTGRFATLSISPTDERVALEDRGDVWVWQLGASGVLRSRLTTTGAGSPRWSPDGRTLSFTTAVSGAKRVLMSQPVDGSVPAQVTLSDDELILDSRWSPVGGWLAFREFRSTLEDIFATRPGTDRSRIVVAATSGNECSPYFSHDGKMIAYMSDESGQPEIYVRPFPEVGEWRLQVSASGGVQPVWDPITTKLYYFDLRGTLRGARVRPPAQGGVDARQSLFETAAWRGSPDACDHEYDISRSDGRFLMLRPTTLSREARLVFVEGFSRELDERGRR